MRLGYNTNGLAFHRWPDALELLADVGYESVAITLDHNCLDPYAAGVAAEVGRMASALGRLKLASVIETGARFLLNPRAKHEPTLMSAGRDERALRIDFLKRAVDIASDLGSDAVSFWSGTLREPLAAEAAMARLAGGCAEVISHAAARKMKLAFEPEPGMFIETFAQYEQLLEQVDAPLFGLTIDIGHVHCVESGPIGDYLRRWASRLYNVHIEDMRKGVHEHLRFGEGEIDFGPVMQALADVDYRGGVHVELSRHSHRAPEVVQESFDCLNRLRRISKSPPA
ncbi:MAG TPA: sugar phosphate isomerase/epimerase family protein [Planctomycetaceae bacterium]|nr:sugar phosphate isomerase/epimerase family protein [Planctomycetaceae bacterium]